jgi:hypothetical protein
MLDDEAAGNIDNIFDIVVEAGEIDDELPRNSQLRPAWDRFYAGCMATLEDSVRS